MLSIKRWFTRSSVIQEQRYVFVLLRVEKRLLKIEFKFVTGGNNISLCNTLAVVIRFFIC